MWIRGKWEGRLGRWLGKHHDVRFCIYINFLVIAIASENFQVLGPCAWDFFAASQFAAFEKQGALTGTKVLRQEDFVALSPAMPEYTSLFFQILAKFTLTTDLVSTGVLRVLPEVDLFLRPASFFFVRFRNSFVVRENSVFFNSMSRFSLMILIKWSVGFSFSSPFTTSIFCFSFLSSVSCFAFNFLISSDF